MKNLYQLELQVRQENIWRYIGKLMIIEGRCYHYGITETDIMVLSLMTDYVCEVL